MVYIYNNIQVSKKYFLNKYINGEIPYSIMSKQVQNNNPKYYFNHAINKLSLKTKKIDNDIYTDIKNNDNEIIFKKYGHTLNNLNLLSKSIIISNALKKYINKRRDIIYEYTLKCDMYVVNKRKKKEYESITYITYEKNIEFINYSLNNHSIYDHYTNFNYIINFSKKDNAYALWLEYKNDNQEYIKHKLDVDDLNIHLNNDHINKFYKKFLDQYQSGSRIISNLKLTKKEIIKPMFIKDDLYFNSSNDIINFNYFDSFKNQLKRQCVPESIYHFIKKHNKKRSKKITYESIIKLLDEQNHIFTDHDPTIGYTIQNLIYVLNHFKINYKLIDQNEKMLYEYKDHYNNKMYPYFIAILYNNHVYLNEDSNYIKKLNTCENIFKIDLHKKTNFEKIKTTIIKDKNLNDYFIKDFNINNTIYKIKTYDNNIIQINKKDEIIVSNTDYDDVKLISKKLNIAEINEKTNMTSLAKMIFDSYHNKILSHFSYKFKAHAGIFRKFNKTSGFLNQYTIDINKCRTSCILDNKYEYSVFDVHCTIEKYEDTDTYEKNGWYYVIDLIHEFIPTNKWYNSHFLQYLNKKNISFNIKYKYLSSSTLKNDYFNDMINEIIDTDPDNYKTIINTMIGYWAKTKNIRSIDSYIETNYDMACRHFIHYYDDIVHKLKNKNDMINRYRQKLKAHNKVIDIFQLNTNTPLYVCQINEQTHEYNTNLNLYNHIVENEYIKLIELYELMTKNLKTHTIIAIKTDNIIIESVSKIDNFYDICNSKIGGYKLGSTTTIKEIDNYKDAKEITYEINEWNNINVEKNDEINNFEKLIAKIDHNKGFCLNALAGYGKSHLIKNLSYYNDEKTIKLSFTNMIAINMAGSTINKYFGIDFNTQKVQEKYINNLSNIDTIIIDEYGLIPLYLLRIIYKIKKKFNNIRIIMSGDPNQNKAVGEEENGYENSYMLKFICDYNKITLITNMRNDMDDIYHSILNTNNLDITKFKMNIKANINIVKTNKMRKNINNAYMDKNGLFMKCYNTMSEYQQDQYIANNMPIMAITAYENVDKNIKILNGMQFKIKNYDEKYIYIDDFKLLYKEYMDIFVPCYAMTNHKFQGSQICEIYTIYEWDKMTVRERYTAVSRSLDKKYIQIEK